MGTKEADRKPLIYQAVLFCYIGGDGKMGIW